MKYAHERHVAYTFDGGTGSVFLLGGWLRVMTVGEGVDAADLRGEIDRAQECALVALADANAAGRLPDPVKNERPSRTTRPEHEDVDPLDGVLD